MDDLAVIIIIAAIMSVLAFKYAIALLGFNEILKLRREKDRRSDGRRKG